MSVGNAGDCRASVTGRGIRGSMCRNAPVSEGLRCVLHGHSRLPGIDTRTGVGCPV